jgi:HK97 family phage major capsid protein
MTEATTETAALTPAAMEAKAEIGALVRDLKGFQERIEAKMKTHDDRIAMLDRKSAQRPAVATAADHAPHRKAIGDYLRHGDENGLRGLSVERKGLTTSVASEGGYLVDGQTAGRISNILRGAGSIRSVATIATVEAGVFEVLVDTGELETGWIVEGASPAETDATRIDKITIPLHELAAMPRASQRLLEDSAFDIEGWLAERIADKFARAENAAFTNGDGVDKPRGFLTHPQVPVANWAWGSLGYVATGAAGGFDATDPADAIVDLIYSLGAQYRGGAVFAMNSKTAGAVRKMKDAEGRFLWAESLSSDQPARLMGYPVVTVEDMPDIGPGAVAIAFGDFGAGYTIAEKSDVRILRDPYSAKPHVQFFASARVGGDVTDFAAIRLLKFSAA